VLISITCRVSAVVDEHYRSFSHNRALDAVMRVVRDANSFIQSHQPWMLAKSRDREALECTLHVGLETARVAALALSPVTPGLSRRILERLGCHPTECMRQHMSSSVAGGRRLGPDTGALFSRRLRSPAVM